MSEGTSGMIYMYYAVGGALHVALGHGPAHIQQAWRAKGQQAPRVLLGTHEPIDAKAASALERKHSLSDGAPVEDALPAFEFRPNPKPNGRYMRRLAQGKANEAAAKAASAK